MPNVCILCAKSSLENTSPKVSFHVFPTCPKKRQLWINQCKLTNREILPNHKICSFHFEPTCFKSDVKRRILYPDAVPTIFGKERVKKTILPRILKEKSKICKKSNDCILCIKPRLKNISSNVSFHVFPTCPKKRQVWINRCKLTNREILPNHKICSFHFEPTCFKSNLKRRILYSDAVPTIFEKRYFKKKYRLSRIMKGKSKGCDKIEMAYQNQESPNILLTKSTKKGNFGSKCESRDISPIKVVKEVFKHDKSIATKRKREFDELDGAVTKLKCKKSSFMSLLKLVRIQFSLGGNRIK